MGGLSRRPGGGRRKWSLRSAVWRPSETDQPLLTVSTPPWYPGGDGTGSWGLVVSLLTHVSCIEDCMSDQILSKRFCEARL